MKKFLMSFIFEIIFILNCYSINLKYAYTINAPDYFYSITDFCILENNCVILLDREGCQIFFNGTYRSLIGQGPGLAVSPRYIFYDFFSQTILIVDTIENKFNFYKKI